MTMTMITIMPMVRATITVMTICTLMSTQARTKSAKTG